MKNNCCNGDSYIHRLNTNHWALYGGVTPSHYAASHADPLASGTFVPLPTGPTYGETNKANLKSMLGDALGGFVGDLIQAKKTGQTLPPILDKAAGLGIKIENSAKQAALESAQRETGKNVLQFSPLIIGVFLGLVLLVLFMFIKK